MSGTLLLATDFSEAARHAYEPAVRLASALGHDVLLLHVLEEHPGYPGSALAVGATVASSRVDELRSRQRQLEKLATEIRAAGVRIIPLVLEHESASKAIVAVATERQCPFIALATHGRTGLRRVLMGSVAEEVLRHARTPVVCYPLHATAAP